MGANRVHRTALAAVEPTALSSECASNVSPNMEQKKKHIKMGNTIYHISPLLRTIFGAQIVHISYTREGVVIRDAMDCEIRMSDIGKTAFFSKEEAKKALEDMIDGTPY